MFSDHDKTSPSIAGFQHLVCFHDKISRILHVRHRHLQICILPEVIN